MSPINNDQPIPMMLSCIRSNALPSAYSHLKDCLFIVKLYVLGSNLDETTLQGLDPLCNIQLSKPPLDHPDYYLIPTNGAFILTLIGTWDDLKKRNNDYSVLQYTCTHHHDNTKSDQITLDALHEMGKHLNNCFIHPITQEMSFTTKDKLSSYSTLRVEFRLVIDIINHNSDTNNNSITITSNNDQSQNNHTNNNNNNNRNTTHNNNNTTNNNDNIQIICINPLNPSELPINAKYSPMFNTNGPRILTSIGWLCLFTTAMHNNDLKIYYCFPIIDLSQHIEFMKTYNLNDLPLPQSIAYKKLIDKWYNDQKIIRKELSFHIPRPNELNPYTYLEEWNNTIQLYYNNENQKIQSKLNAKRIAQEYFVEYKKLFLQYHHKQCQQQQQEQLELEYIEPYDMQQHDEQQQQYYYNDQLSDNVNIHDKSNKDTTDNNNNNSNNDNNNKTSSNELSQLLTLSDILYNNDGDYYFNYMLTQLNILKKNYKLMEHYNHVNDNSTQQQQQQQQQQPQRTQYHENQSLQYHQQHYHHLYYPRNGYKNNNKNDYYYSHHPDSISSLSSSISRIDSLIEHIISESQHYHNNSHSLFQQEQQHKQTDYQQQQQQQQQQQEKEELFILTNKQKSVNNNNNNNNNDMNTNNIINNICADNILITSLKEQVILLQQQIDIQHVNYQQQLEATNNNYKEQLQAKDQEIVRLMQLLADKTNDNGSIANYNNTISGREEKE